VTPTEKYQGAGMVRVPGHPGVFREPNPVQDEDGDFVFTVHKHYIGDKHPWAWGIGLSVEEAIRAMKADRKARRRRPLRHRRKR